MSHDHLTQVRAAFESRHRGSARCELASGDFFTGSQAGSVHYIGTLTLTITIAIWLREVCAKLSQNLVNLEAEYEGAGNRRNGLDWQETMQLA